MQEGKLVRDKIPEIIKHKGETPITHIANDREYWEKLKEKLREEVSEFLVNNDEKELGDILEVINAICKFKVIDKKRLNSITKNKAKEKGRFDKKIILEKVNSKI